MTDNRGDLVMGPKRAYTRLMDHERFRIPDWVFFTVVALTVGATWFMILYFLPFLPSRIPSHFGFGGTPDAWVAKSFWSVAVPGLAQLVVAALMLVVYRWPQYSNIPTTIAIVLLPPEVKSMIYHIIRHMSVVILTIVSLLFAYIELTIISTAIGSTSGLNAWMIGGLIAFLFLVVIVYSVWMYRLTKAGAALIQGRQIHRD